MHLNFIQIKKFNWEIDVCKETQYTAQTAIFILFWIYNVKSELLYLATVFVVEDEIPKSKGRSSFEAYYCWVVKPSWSSPISDNEHMNLTVRTLAAVTLPAASGQRGVSSTRRLRVTGLECRLWQPKCGSVFSVCTVRPCCFIGSLALGSGRCIEL